MRRLGRMTAITIAVTFAAGLASPLRGQERQVADGSLRRLERELARLDSISGNYAGVALHHVETGRSLSLNGSVPFRMASTVKVPLAVHILSLVDDGKVKLSDLVTLDSTDIVRTYGPISAFLSAGTRLTIRDLVTLMLKDSDNTATYLLYDVGGGPGAVKARMRSLGLNHITHDDLLVRSGSAAGTPWAGTGDDIRDTSTPSDMAALLTMVFTGKVLKPSSRRFMLDVMYACLTGPNRLKGKLPPGVRVAHKTGSLFVDINDVGIVDLPGDAGHLVIAVFTRTTPQLTAWPPVRSTSETPGQLENPLQRQASMVASRESLETLIAEISRTSFDYFTTHCCH